MRACVRTLSSPNPGIYHRNSWRTIICFTCGGCHGQSGQGNAYSQANTIRDHLARWEETSCSHVLGNSADRSGSENNDIAVPPEFKSISRRHIEIRREGKSYRLIDLGSSNGVYVNGQKVENIVLQDGDEIRIGETNDQQEVQILFQLGTEFLASAEVSEQATRPPASSLSSVIPENLPYLSVRFPNGQVRYFPIQNKSPDLAAVQRQGFPFPIVLSLPDTSNCVKQAVSSPSWT